MEKRLKVIIGLSGFLLAGLGLASFLFWEEKSSKQKAGSAAVQSGEKIVDENFLPVEEKGEEGIDLEETELVGNDADEHGCIGSAGYVWCQSKQKCLRQWEEACDENPQSAIQAWLAEEHNLPIEKVSVKIDKQESEHAAGGVAFGAGGPGEEGMFLAVKQNGAWEVVFEGIGAVDCEKMKTVYGFSNEMLSPNFCD